MKKSFLYLILAIAGMSCTPSARQSAQPFDEPDDPDTLAVRTWQGATGRVHAAFGSTDIRYERSKPPTKDLSVSWQGTAWRGERVATQVVVWSSVALPSVTVGCTPLQGDSSEITGEAIALHPLGYVLADTGFTGCRRRSQDTMKAMLSPEILYDNRPFPLAARSVRPVWLSIRVPSTAPAGIYHGSVVISTGEDSLYLPLTLRVQEMTLPPPSDWHFHLDLWQNPFAVARYHGVALWSQEHWDLIRKYLHLLASAGQKCITTSIIDKPWGGQTYDPFGAMIGFVRNHDGTWDYDYSVFDQYVETAMEEGITEQISCYTMVPWGNRFRYYDEDSAATVTLEARPGSAEYEAFWEPFLQDFTAHLKEKGWYERTAIALDERGEEDTRHLIAFLHRSAPGLKLTLAGGYYPSVIREIYDFSYYFWHLDREKTPLLAAGRRSEGKITTWYVACNVPHPNDFTFSPPAEATLQGWITAALGLDGFLRWAYNSWPEDVMHDSRFRTWPSGDTYFVYPGPYSSVRFEKLREGIQDYTKIAILQERIREKDRNIPDSLDLRKFLEQLDPRKIRDASLYTREGRKILSGLTDLLSGD